MTETYFEWLATRTPSRVWVNNPSQREIGLALGRGAVGCTTNPAYGGGLARRAPEEVRPVVKAVVAEIPDDDAAADEVQRRLVRRILPSFGRLFETSGGRQGLVSLQGAPERDTDAASILAEARDARALAPNCVPKIPATDAGLRAFEVLVEEDQPTLVTEVFSLDQLIESCERYLRITARTGRRPVFILAPITGIFGDHLRKVVARDGVAVPPELPGWAGLALSRAAAALVRERGYPVSLLFGGARTTRDVTGLVGGPHAATINGSTFEEVLADDPERRETIEEPVPAGVMAELTRHFEEVRRALTIGSLAVTDFAGFGPVQHFRDNFIAGWRGVLEIIREERGSVARTPAS